MRHDKNNYYKISERPIKMPGEKKYLVFYIYCETQLHDCMPKANANKLHVRNIQPYKSLISQKLCLNPPTEKQCFTTHAYIHKSLMQKSPNMTSTHLSCTQFRTWWHQIRQKWYDWPIWIELSSRDRLVWIYTKVTLETCTNHATFVELLIRDRAPL